jgi:hypothetical protein
MRLSEILWAIGVLLATAAFVASPFLSPGFGGFEPSQFPVPQNDPPVQPEGYAFAIWGPIYAWLSISAVFGLALRRHAPDWQAMRPQLTLSLALGAGWLPIATISPLAATVLIWLMLISALKAAQNAPVLDRWWARAPVAIYAGWLSAASAVSLGLVLGGWGLLDEVAAAGVALVIATALAFAMQLRLSATPEYGAAVIWALIAIAIGNAADGSGVIIALALAGGFATAYAMLRALTD